MSAQFNLRGELLANEHESKIRRHLADEIALPIFVRTGQEAKTLTLCQPIAGGLTRETFVDRNAVESGRAIIAGEMKLEAA